MAERLIQQWRLCVLRLEVDLGVRIPTVAVSLTAYDDRTPRTLWRQEHSLGAFGIPRRGTPEALVVPEAVVTAVQRSFAQDLPSETALWLRLVPPYGYLGGAPWESRLMEVIDRPVLRVPDRLPAAVDFGSTWSAAVAIRGRPASTWAVDYVRSFLDELRSAVVGELDVHVFADAETTRRLQDALQPHERERDHWWHLHHPPPEARVRSRESPWRTAWSEWLIADLSRQSVRSLHIVTDAAFDGDRPSLLVTPGPLQADAAAAQYVPVDAALRLGDALGAATLSFGSPPDNVSDLATRMLVDEVGQRRAGPTLYSSIAQDPGGRALAAMHAFLADRDDVVELPWHESLFLFVQPEHVRACLQTTWPTAPVAPRGPAPRPDEARDVPMWVAASHRYLGDAWSKVAPPADAAGADLAPVEAGSPAYDDGVREALEELRGLIDEHGGA